MRFVKMLVSVGLASSLCSAPALTQSIDDRVKKLENKTDFYVKKSRIFKKSKSASPRLSSLHNGPTTQSACSSVVGEIVVDPGVTMGGTLHGWMKATVTYTNGPDNIFVNWGNTGFPCGNTVTTTQSSGVAELKGYCSFDVQPGSKFSFNFGSGRGACLQNVQLEFKTTIIEVIEPNF